MTWFQRRPKAGRTTDVEIEEQRRQGTVLERALTIVLPLAIVILFLLWFGTIPDYRAKPLPEDWQPGGIAWNAEWQFHGASGDAKGLFIDWARDNSGTPGLLLVELGGEPLEGCLRRIDPVTGAVLATSPVLEGQLNPNATASGIWMSPFQLPLPSSDVPVLDLRTLQPLAKLQIRNALPAGRIAPQTLLALELCSLPDGGWTGVCAEANAQARTSTNWWLRFDRTGALIDTRQLSGSTFFWELQAVEGRQVFVGAEFASSSAPAQAHCIAADTGEALDLTVYSSRDWTRLHGGWSGSWPQLRPGWVVAPASRMALAAEAIALFGYPETLADPSQQPPVTFAPESTERWSRAALISQAAWLRRACWELRYTDEEIEAARFRAAQVVGLQIPLGGNRNYEFSPADVAAVAVDPPLVDEVKRFSRRSASPPQVKSSEKVLRTPIQYRQLIDGRWLVQHRLAQPPATLSSELILRLGILDPATLQLEWLGWTVWPAEVPHTLQTRYRFPNVGRHGDHLILQFPAIKSPPASTDAPAPGSDFAWLTVPLPETLRTMPEGVWR